MNSYTEFILLNPIPDTMHFDAFEKCEKNTEIKKI